MKHNNMILRKKPLIAAPAFRQAGFSLIELMVAVLIGLFITLGLSQMFVSMYSTSKSQTNLNQYQENQRLGVVMLQNTVQLAGYFSTLPATSNYAATALPAFTNSSGDGAAFVAGAGVTGAVGYPSSGTDSIDIYYQTSGTDNLINCQGGVATVNPTLYVNTFFVNTSNQLVCTVTIPPSTKPSSQLILASGISSMTINYAVDTLAAGTTNSYMNAKNVQTNAMWGNVRAAVITLNYCTANMINPGSTACGSTTPWIQTINFMSKS